MASKRLNGVLDHVRKLAGQATDALSDQTLLDRFIAERDEAAFTALAERHGPMVLAVCRRVLHDVHDAEDACQAVFLVLARKAACIRKKESLPSWLHGVAYHVATNLKRQLLRRWAREATAAGAATDAGAGLGWHDVRRLLDEELARLPEAYRAPLVLCYLAGKTRDEAAQQLGWRLSTLRGRLERGRQRLRARLTRRGLTFSAALLATALAESSTPAALPPTLLVRTVKGALLPSIGKMGVPVSSEVTALTVKALPHLVAAPRRATLGLALALAAGLGIGLLVSGRRSVEPAKSSITSVNVTPPASWSGIDMDGDRLPTGALRRLGSLRFRQGGFVEKLWPLPGGQALLSNASSDGTGIPVWDLTSGKILRHFPGDRDSAITLTRDGATLAVAFGDAIQFSGRSHVGGGRTRRHRPYLGHPDRRARPPHSGWTAVCQRGRFCPGWQDLGVE
jgi:RNA polymerase sigma factor (sigma-70 family)